MLIESIARSTLGIKDHRVAEVVQAEDGMTVCLELRRRRRLPCSRCGTRGRVRDRLKERTWRHVPLWGIPVTLRYAPARVRCARCGAVCVEAIPWSQGKCRLSVGLIWLLAAWTKLLAWDVVARLFGVHWNTVAAAVRQAVAYGLAHRKMGRTLYIGVDELSRRRGHVYVTNVYDLDDKRLLWSGEGRGKGVPRSLLRRTRRRPERQGHRRLLRHVATLHRRHSRAPSRHRARLRQVPHRPTTPQGRRRGPAGRGGPTQEDQPGASEAHTLPLAEEPRRTSRRSSVRGWGYLEKLNLRTNRAYLLKEAFRELWAYARRGWARRFLKKWFWWATHSRLESMRDFAWTLRRHEEDILNYFDVPISNSAVEGMNNKAKVVSHRCYGFRTAKTFITALYHCLGKLPEPRLVHRFL